MNNKHGLDSRYFKEKLGQLVRDIDNYTPDEMALALERLARVAKPKPEPEPEESHIDYQHRIHDH